MGYLRLLVYVNCPILVQLDGDRQRIGHIQVWMFSRVLKAYRRSTQMAAGHIHGSTCTLSWRDVKPYLSNKKHLCMLASRLVGLQWIVMIPNNLCVFRRPVAWAVKVVFPEAQN